MIRSLVCISFLLVAVNAIPSGKAKSGTEQLRFEAVPVIKRDAISDLAKEEQAAGRAVLKLLDAKIGSKVQDAAKEVTEFLASAVGHHAKQRTKKLHQDKEKEMSLLHLGAKKIVNINQADKPKKNKDGSFLVHFKIPYIVTPIKHKKPHHKKHHHHHHRHHKYYHHHHHRHPHPHHVTHHADPAPPPIKHNSYGMQHATQAPYQPGYNNNVGLPYSTGSDPTGGMVPCQGMCMAPCTPYCSMNSDCCCCSDASAAIPPASVPIGIPPPPPPLLPPQAPLLPIPAPPACLPGCRRHCFSYCPRPCCGLAGKRSEVAGAEGSGTTAEENSEQEDTEDESSAAEDKEETESAKNDNQVQQAEQTKEQPAQEEEVQNTETAKFVQGTQQTEAPQEQQAQQTEDEEAQQTAAQQVQAQQAQQTQAPQEQQAQDTEIQEVQETTSQEPQHAQQQTEQKQESQTEQGDTEETTEDQNVEGSANDENDES